MYNRNEVDRKLIEILRVLSEQDKPVGARLIARKLGDRGYLLDERTVRYHLKFLDERGLTKNLGYDGRVITEKGLEELRNAFVTDRIGFIITKIESLIFRADFDVRRGKGNVIVNIATLNKKHFNHALKIMRTVALAGYAVSPLVKIFDEGDTFEGQTVPKGKVIITTLCSITLDAILHHAGIPISPMFGGIIQILEGKPVRFTELISYSGSTLDPLEIFSAKGLSSVLRAVETGSGYALANFREIPMDAMVKAKEELRKAEEFGIGGIIQVGGPNAPVLGVPVRINHVGIAIFGGTNPLTALSEAGIPVEIKAIEGLLNIKEMVDIKEI
jgi:hypothetical protein